MKKIILFSLVFGLIATTANATYYKTSTNNCSDANMLARLDAATAAHRAVITDVTCDYVVPVRPAPVMPRPVFKPAPRPVMPMPTVSESYFYESIEIEQVYEYKPVVVVPTVTVVTEEDTCDCVTCGC